MTVALYNVQGVSIPLKNNIPTIIVQLSVPNTGLYVVFGRVTVINLATSVQGFTAILTTLDGATQLDTASVYVPTENTGGVACITLQGALNPTLTGSNDLVDMRCSAVNGDALYGSLFAISVDQITMVPVV